MPLLANVAASTLAAELMTLESTLSTPKHIAARVLSASTRSAMLAQLRQLRSAVGQVQSAAQHKVDTTPAALAGARAQADPG